MGLPDFDLYIFGIRSSWRFQNGMSPPCPVLFLNLTCGADVLAPPEALNLTFDHRFFAQLVKKRTNYKLLSYTPTKILLNFPNFGTKIQMPHFWCFW